MIIIHSNNQEPKFSLPSTLMSSPLIPERGHLLGGKSNYLVRGVPCDGDSPRNVNLIDIGLSDRLRISRGLSFCKTVSSSYFENSSQQGDFFSMTKESFQSDELVTNPKFSRFNSHQERLWSFFAKSFRKRLMIQGRILNRVKGGLSVGLAGKIGFYPKGQISYVSSFITYRRFQQQSTQMGTKTGTDSSVLLGAVLNLYIAKISRVKNNIVVVSAFKGSRLWQKLRSLNHKDSRKPYKRRNSNIRVIDMASASNKKHKLTI